MDPLGRWDRAEKDFRFGAILTLDEKSLFSRGSWSSMKDNFAPTYCLTADGLGVTLGHEPGGSTRVLSGDDFLWYCSAIVLEESRSQYWS